MADLSSPEWEEEYRQNIITQTFKYLDECRRLDPHFNLAMCEGMLDTLYANQGDNYVGKGHLVELREASTITAYELYLLQWKEEEEAAAQKQ